MSSGRGDHVAGVVATGDPGRRAVLGTGAAGILSLTLPSAAAAASGPTPAAITSEQPTGVTAVPIGYVSGGTTGAIRVTWQEVTGAASYEIRHSTTAGTYTTTQASPGTGTTADLTGLPGTDTTHHLVVVALDANGATSTPSAPTTSSPVIATGGTVTTFIGNGTIGTTDVRYVVHTFAAAGAGSVTLNRGRTIDYLVVGGGGGGAGDGGGGGGGGAVRSGSHTFADVATVALQVGAGGRAGAWSGGISTTAGGASTITLAGTTYTVHGGSGGGGGPSGAAGAGGSGGDATEAGGAGGSGSAGGDTSGNPGTGGPTSTISGTSTRYGGGGGGGVYFTNNGRFVGGAGGAGGGGDGAIISSDTLERAAEPGDVGTGGGGGAGTASYLGETAGDGTGYRVPGGAGGTGVVIVRYALP